MGDILKEILNQLPEGKISSPIFEGANIVLYTKDKDFFLDNGGSIRKVVNDIDAGAFAVEFLGNMRAYKSIASRYKDFQLIPPSSSK